MNGIINISNTRTEFYPERKNFDLPEKNFDSRNNRNVPEDVSKMFKAAQESGYSPISFDLFENDDIDAAGNTHGIILNPGASTHKAVGRKSSPAECETCANRKYQDGSDEMDVSFKTPSHISPNIAASVILGHEHEHVANAYEKERKGEAKVQRASVSLHTDICPECGRVYISGGVTHTEMKYTDDDDKKPADDLRGAFVDLDT